MYFIQCIHVIIYFIITFLFNIEHLALQSYILPFLFFYFSVFPFNEDTLALC